VHTAGSVGGATGIVATSLVQAGLHRRVLAHATGGPVLQQNLVAVLEGK